MRLVSAALALMLAAVPGAAQEVELTLNAGETLLQVEAEGMQAARPDVMTIAAGVVTTGATAAEALGANNALAEQVVERIRGAGVAPADLRTRELSVRPQYDEREERGGAPPRITGYIASNVVELRLRELNRAGEIIGAAFAAGANTVSGPGFSLADDSAVRRAAARDAVRLAREEADNYALALGMRVTRILRVSERSRTGDGVDYIVVSGSRMRATPIEPGEIETKVKVWIDFALVPR